MDLEGTVAAENFVTEAAFMLEEWVIGRILGAVQHRPIVLSSL